LGREEIKKTEPNIFGIAALHSSETGIFDSHIFMQRLFSKTKDNGATVVFDSEALAIKKESSGYTVAVKDGSGKTDLSAKVVINCAGLDSDLVAGMAGINIKINKYELHYCKGQYFRVNQKKARLVNRLIYPVPEPRAGGLGIHATPDLGGGLRLGPDHQYLSSRIKDYSLDQSKRTDFYNSVKRFLPFIKEDDIAPDTAGIRPKLQSQDGKFRDFVIREEREDGFPGLINLIGIESPGLTASLAIAEYVGYMIRHSQALSKGR
jgi:L-2-hydroxyglutarate oxidase LhgO